MCFSSQIREVSGIVKWCATDSENSKQKTTLYIRVYDLYCEFIILLYTE